MRSPHQQILVLSWPFWTIEKTKDLGRSAEEKLNPVPVAIFFTGFNCSSLMMRFKTSVSSQCEATTIRFSLLVPLRGLLAMEFGGGAGRDMTGFRIIPGMIEHILDSVTLTTVSTSFVFGGHDDGTGFAPSCVCDRCKRQRKDPACFVGAHKQVILTGGVSVETFPFFAAFFDEILADGVTAHGVTDVDFSPEEGACGFNTAFRRFEACILSVEEEIASEADETPDGSKRRTTRTQRLNSREGNRS